LPPPARGCGLNATNKDVKAEIVSGRSSDKPDIGSNIANQWIDVDKST